ncbi:MAG: DUF4301 family protein [Paramuribaculum sp.]|nr:DUF4301 family protein [Paramuribaculum sp.]
MTENDLQQIQQKGITPQMVEEQLARFRTGFPYLKIDCAATEKNGIATLTPVEEQAAIERWQQYLEQGGEVMKFVPASGAASRMFKALFEFVDGPDTVAAPGSPLAKLLENLDKLPFLKDLNEVCVKLHGADAKTLLENGKQKEVIAAIILPEGLNYGGLPKGLLKFHSYDGEDSRTPLEEHLMEGAQTAADSTGTVHLHFTVSSNHRDLFLKKIEEVVPAMEKKTGVKFDISLSEQKPSTDTIAANPDNTPFIEEGKLLFRPGGHGALIANLNDIDSTVVFIKNIDNVVPDSRRESTIRYKTVIAGYMMEIHDKIAAYRRSIATGAYDREKLIEIRDFLKKVLATRLPADTEQLDDHSLAVLLDAKLDRPLRVCGMVRNEGEPGGGPFIAYNADGSSSPQILESHQIDPDNKEYAEMLKSATHFNPVDLVCYLRDTHGNHFDLLKYVDQATGFISSKSSHGKELKALELPGLWNGAMSDWNTAFVEVPASTFNPVKTVNDLLRPAHQS